MAELCECLCVFTLCFTGSINRDQILFGLWEPVRWAGAGLRLLTEMDATFNVIKGDPLAGRADEPATGKWPDGNQSSGSRASTAIYAVAMREESTWAFKFASHPSQGIRYQPFRMNSDAEYV